MYETNLISFRFYSPLDRERQAVYNFHVVATDGGRSDSRSQHVPVQIHLADRNDNRPRFASYPFRAHVAAFVQPGQQLHQLHATDADAGTNGEVLYKLINEASIGLGRFRLNPNTGALSATQSLANETGRLLRLEIEAHDKGNPSQSARGLLELRVGDVPAGQPELRFPNDSFVQMDCMENTQRGVRIGQVQAVRSDGRRQVIRYALGSGNEDGGFAIDAQTGELRVADASVLDFERSEERRLTVVARTETPLPLFGYCDVLVRLLDENDNVPHFTQQQYVAAVREGNSKGTLVQRVQALDADREANGRVLYHIVDGNHDNAFVIEPAFSGVVRTNIVLDREIRDVYRLKVIATDEGVPQMTGTATVRVHIIDVNDNQPTFPPHSIISISEGMFALLALLSTDGV